MSLYNALFGVEPTAGIALKMLGIGPQDVPRFRDAYFTWENTETMATPVIVVRTRTGGGNRDFYQSEHRCRANYPEYFTGDEPPTGPWNDDLIKLPGYLFDQDDDGDCTYANFYYSVPKAERETVVAHLTAAGPPATLTEKFDAAIAAIKGSK